MSLSDKIKSRTVLSKKPELPEISAAAGESAYEQSSHQWLSARLQETISAGRRIVLFGDFDVDGTSSAAVLFLFLKMLGYDFVSALISRRDDGYGLTEKSIQRIVKDSAGHEKGQLVILMDLGVNSWQGAEQLLKLGMRVMVIDHHVPSPGAAEHWSELQKKYGSENIFCFDPLLSEDSKDLVYTCLSAAGLCYKVVTSILSNENDPLSLMALSRDKVTFDCGTKVHVATVVASLDKICAIAQASDCMPFVKDGRTTEAWRYGRFMEQAETVMAGLSLLCEKTSTASRVGWVIGPILNAAGRIGDAQMAFQLLTEANRERAQALLNTISEVRTSVQTLTQVSMEMVENDMLNAPGVGIAVLLNSSGGKVAGIAGIAAARAADAFKTPALYLSFSGSASEQDPILKGSMRRGPTDFSCEKWLLSLKEAGVIIAGGGHPAAAGLSLRLSQLETLVDSASKASFNEAMPVLHESSVDDAEEYLERIRQVVPFGQNHNSAELLVSGELVMVRALTTARSGEPVCWAFELTLKDYESRRTRNFKLMANDITAEELAFFSKIASSNIKLHARIIAVAHDSYRVSSRYDRMELRVAVVAAAADSVETPSMRHALIEILERPATVGATETDGPAELSAMAERSLEQSEKKLICHLDWRPEFGDYVFLLKKPSKWQVEENIGEEASEDFSKLVGGRWDSSLRGYRVTHGVLDLIDKESRDPSGPWMIEFSKEARAQMAKIAEFKAGIVEQKKNSSPLAIPFLRKNIVPRGFQYADTRMFLQRSLALCNNDMGTGKTLEAGMWAAAHLRGGGIMADGDLGFSIDEDPRATSAWKIKGDYRPVIFSTLKGVAGQYRKELEKFFDLSVAILETAQVSRLVKQMPRASKKRTAALIDLVSAAPFIVTTYDCLSRHPWILESLRLSGIVFDEAHELKNPSSKRTMAVLGPEIDGAPLSGAPIFAASGTFAKNRPQDLFVWTRLSGSDGGIYAGGPIKNAAVRFGMRFDGLVFEQIRVRGGRKINRSTRKTPENGEELKKILEPFIVRRLKTEIDDIPSIEVRLERVASSSVYMNAIGYIRGSDLCPKLASLLEKHNIGARSGMIDGEAVDVEKGSAVAKDLDDDPKSLSSRLALLASLDKAVGIVDTVKSFGWSCKDEPFVVVSMHKSAAIEANERLAEAGYSTILMMQQDDISTREQKVKAFQSGEAQVFVTTYGVGGTGLNLVRASRMILLSLPWIATSILQARDRIHRLGQTKQCDVRILLLSASIDESTWHLVSMKGKANYKTQSIDKLKKGKLPGWATGHLSENITKNTIENANNYDELHQPLSTQLDGPGLPSANALVAGGFKKTSDF